MLKAFTSYDLACVSIGTRIRLRSYASFLRGKKYKNCLECGCGIGVYTSFLKTVADHLVSCDLNPVLIEQAKNIMPDVYFLVADIVNLPFKDGTFELVVAPDVVEHTSDARKALKELSRVIRAGGTFVMSVPCISRDRIYHSIGSTKEASGHNYLFDNQLLLSCLQSAGFTIIHHHKTQRIISALIEAIFVKTGTMLYGSETVKSSNMTVAASGNRLLSYCYYWGSRILYPFVLLAESFLPRSLGVEHFVVATKTAG